ncbi:alpha-ketoglutarate-dependent dioxygenase AlkB [Variovorax sp.]|uniref:alpha-ketoglutarate-dependent dioxygenase AlkB n=1 Tax=Variovorax sp. TaxID=1871043 RepID=UPI003BAD3833
MSGPPIHLDPAFVASPDALLEWLRSAVTWDERMRARQTASFGVPYDYSQIAYEAAPIPAQLEALCDRIEAALGFRPNNCLLNRYADGASSMGFHSDALDTGARHGRGHRVRRRHAIPKADGAGERISLTFREILK